MKGEFKIKGIVGSGMVLQRNKINCIFGSAEVYSDVMLTFRGITSITQSDEEGNWKLEFSPGEAGGPFEMLVQCDDKKIKFDEVYVGEVWVNAGQSNAQLPMERMRFSYPEEFLQPEDKFIRMITIPIDWSLDEEKDELPQTVTEANADEGTKAQNQSGGVKWECASPQTLGDMSGTGYFFAKKLREDLRVPVGIINASQGGSPITAWMSQEALEEMGDKQDYLKELKKFQNKEYQEKTRKKINDDLQKWYAEIEEGALMPDFNSDTGWKTVKIPNDFMVSSAGIYWFKKEIILTQEQLEHFKKHGARLWMGSIVESDIIYVNGTKVGETPYCYPPRRYSVPSELLKVGTNLIVIRVRVNYKKGGLRFFDEKPYFLFTENVRVIPVAARNVEVMLADLQPVDGELIPLSGEWKMKEGYKIRDIPPDLFMEWLPTALYNSMLAPCFKHAVAGVVWYQGESNAPKYEEYKGLLVKLITLWRKKFVYGSKNLPFIVMQLPNWSNGYGEEPSQLFSDWALLREAQAEAVDMVEGAGLAVTIDAGEWNDLHPEKKLTCGTRAAFEALRIAYGKYYISPSPKYDWCKTKRFKHIIHFDCGNSSLYTCKVDGNYADWTKEDNSGKVWGFSLLCEKHGSEYIVNAPAKLKNGTTVEVTIPIGCGKVKELRYLWANNPAPVNLYSRGWIPVGPFRIVQG